MSEIVVGFDGSKSSQDALEWAAAEASLRSLPLRVIQSWRDPVPVGPTVVGMWYDPGTPVGQVREALEAHIARLMADYPDVAYVCELTEEGPSRALVKESERADLLVVGARGRGGFFGLHLGSVSNRVARHAEAPVVVIRGSADAGERPDIVVGVDGSSCSRHALTWAAEAARHHDKRLVVLMAWSYLEPEGSSGPVEFRADYTEEDANKALAEIVADVLGPVSDIAVVQQTVCDLAPRAVLEHTTDASLVVVGRQGTSRWAPFDLGTTSQQVLHHADCPVAVIPAPSR